MGSSLDTWLKELIEVEGQDLMVVEGQSPSLHRNKAWTTHDAWAAVSEKAFEQLLDELLTADQRRVYDHGRSVDFAVSLHARRFRGQVFDVIDHAGVARRKLTVRLLPAQVPTLEQIGLAALRPFALLHQGLVLSTGPTGSGKSTTQAALVRARNESAQDHILTLEDPVEYLHEPAQAQISQREIGVSTPTFAAGLKDAMRETPDVVLVGEMRDRESIALALTLAQTGHLVLATLHTNSAAEAINRIIDVHPGDEQSQVRAELAACLEVVLAQHLLTTATDGLIAAVEVMLGTPSVRSAIREDRAYQLDTVMAANRADGHVPLNDALAELIYAGAIDKEVAFSVSRDHEELDRRLAYLRTTRV